MTERVLPEVENARSKKRWSMLKLWVTEPVFTSVTRAMLSPLSTVTWKSCFTFRLEQRQELRPYRAISNGVEQIGWVIDSAFRFVCGPGAPPPPTRTDASGRSKAVE